MARTLSAPADRSAAPAERRGGAPGPHSQRGLHRALFLQDLLIAATAESHRRTVLHYDGGFDMIASLTGQPTEWAVPPGSADR